jgi:hypothetical protein
MEKKEKEYSTFNNIAQLIEEYNISPDIYMPKVDAIINKAIDKGVLHVATNYASKYNHASKEELSLLNSILR